MAHPRRELWKALDALEYHARRMTLAATEVRAQLAALAIEPPPPEGPSFSCSCDRVFRSERELAIHRQNVHDGPAVPLDELEARS
jgi:hypothetical protein